MAHTDQALCQTVLINTMLLIVPSELDTLVLGLHTTAGRLPSTGDNTGKHTAGKLGAWEMPSSFFL